MGTEIMFGCIEIGKQKFQCYKNPILLEDVDLDNALVSNKTSSGKKNNK